jgi:hypothetical protein
LIQQHLGSLLALSASVLSSVQHCSAMVKRFLEVIEHHLCLRFPVALFEKLREIGPILGCLKHSIRDLSDLLRSVISTDR